MNELLLSEWDYKKNDSIDPHTVAEHSQKKYYWICPKGHPSYLMRVAKRTLGHGCPVCSNHKIVKGINDFATTNPELMQEWCWEKNEEEGIDPSTFSYGSSRYAWWKCKKCGNIWKASVSNRTHVHSGCPYCANFKVKKGFNDLATLRPDLAEEWYQEKNGTLTPDAVVECYAKKVWWKCKSCGNIWEASPNARKRRGCPYCCNHVKIAGFNDFESQFPNLVKEWDYEKNMKLPSQYAAGSDAKVWWKCDKGHSWKAQINSRVKGNGCPYCGNKKVLVGYNDFFTTNPELKDEWDYAKNLSISPDMYTAGSNKKVWWICKKCGRSWQAIISSRSKGSGCPDCAKEASTIGRLKIMASNNPLFAQYPHLADEWDYEKNNLDLSLIPASSNRIVWWKCPEGHSYKAQINSRTKNNSGCPYCHGQKVLTGINDLQTLNPGLAAEWDYKKNYPLKPSDVFSHGSKHVWWKCPNCGNSWKAKIHNRANGRGCPACNPYGTSFVEQTFYFYIRQVYSDAENRYSYNGVELDIYIPSTKTGIEYDGSFFHSSLHATERERKKDQFCKENGIRLIRVREVPLSPTPGAINFSCDASSWEKIESACGELIHYLNPDADLSISMQRDYPEINRFKKKLQKEEYYQYSLFSNAVYD